MDAYYNLGFSYNLEQEINSQNTLAFNKIESEKDYIDSFESDIIREILKVDNFIRIDERNKYILHKSYPSPRAIYPLELVIFTNGKFISMNKYSNKMFYKKNILYGHSAQYKEMDIVINIRDFNIYPGSYNKIKKSLLLLEIGHLIYNIILKTKSLGLNYKVSQINEDNIVMEVISQKEKLSHEVELEVSILNKVFINRSSGPQIPLISYKNCSKDRILNQFEYSTFKGIIPIIENKILILNFKKEKDYFTVNNIKIHYTELNNILSTINFKLIDELFIFLYHENFIKLNLTSQIIDIGSSCQEKILLSTINGYFSRPMKSFDMAKTELLVRKIGIRNFIPHYFLVNFKK